MSGHSKWATTKHKKAAIDAKRGKLFAKLIKNIEVAARVGGGDLSGNPTLYDAVQKAKKNSVPADNIDRAVKRGSGAEGDGAAYDTIMYEAYAGGSVAILIECLTDNRNRAFADVRIAVTRNGATLADGGSVQRLFSRRGVIEVAKHQEGRTLTEDDLLEATMDAMPEEIIDEGEGFTVLTDAPDLVDVRKAIQASGLDYESADVVFWPSFEQVVDDVDQATKIERVVEALEDLDDVQNVYTNAKYSDAVERALNEGD